MNVCIYILGSLIDILFC